VRPGLASALCTLATGCAWFGGSSGPAPDLGQGVELADTEAIVGFYERASTFYGRLAHRRFNTLATFQDDALREHFENERAYSDYYADLADALRVAHFEKNRPLDLEVTELLLEGPGRARVRVRIAGENGLPLRFWSTEIEREDRWERHGGQWWIAPGKL
jgi:hypothetical protein